MPVIEAVNGVIGAGIIAAGVLLLFVTVAVMMAVLLLRGPGGPGENRRGRRRR